MSSIVIVDNHALIRASIRRLLQDFDEVSIIGEAENGEEGPQGED